MTQLNTRIKRQVRYYWASLDNVNTATTGASSVAALGTAGATSQRVFLDEIATSRIEHLDQVNAHGLTGWGASRDPILRAAVTPDTLPAFGDFFVGFRASKVGTRPTTENHAGLLWYGSLGTFYATQGNGAAGSTVALTTPRAGELLVVEIAITSGASVVYRVNGRTVATNTAAVPSGTLFWQLLLAAYGGGSAVAFNLVATMLRLEEDLA